MIKFNISEDQQWMILIESPDEVEKKQIELSLTKKIHNFYFHPLVKKKLWDGSICFVEKRGSFWKVPIGLWREVLQIGEDFNIEIEINGLDKIINKELTLEDFTDWVNKFFEDGVGGDPGKQVRDYQIETAWKIIKYRYSISEVATSSGKTLISFIILAYLKSKGLIRKFLMVVPNTNLVFQGTDDFDDYGLNKLGIKVQQIGGGNKIREGCDVIIGTFQSLVKQESEFFSDVDLVFVDEAHHTNSQSIKKIVSQCMHSKWRFGLTGTLTKRGTADYLTIQQFLGPLVMEIPPSFLFDNNYATPVSIKVVVMDWLEPEYKEKLAELKTNDNNLEGNDLYNLERKLVVESKTRLNYVVDFISKTSKNSLVLFQLVEKHGKQLHSMIFEKAKNRHVFFVYGGTDVEIRESVREITEKENNAIIVASYGTFSTGVNIRNLHNVIFASPSKSRVRNLQSIGRGLRIGDNKKEAVLFDIADDFRVGKHVNFTLKHFIERVKIYDEEKFKYKFYNIEVKDA